MAVFRDEGAEAKFRDASLEPSSRAHRDPGLPHPPSLVYYARSRIHVEQALCHSEAF